LLALLERTALFPLQVTLIWRLGCLRQSPDLPFKLFLRVRCVVSCRVVCACAVCHDGVSLYVHYIGG
jgi:hypothetical protein